MNLESNKRKSEKIIEQYRNRKTKLLRAYDEFDGIVNTAPNKAFPLLCPTLEADWVPGWEAELIYTQSGYAEDKCVFKTADKDIQSWDESKMYQYRAQQSIYRNLIYNMTGIMPSEISLLPMQVDVDIQNEGYINDIILEELDGTKPVKNSSAVGIEYL